MSIDDYFNQTAPTSRAVIRAQQAQAERKGVVLADILARQCAAHAAQERQAQAERERHEAARARAERWRAYVEAHPTVYCGREGFRHPVQLDPDDIPEWFYAMSTAAWRCVPRSIKRLQPRLRWDRRRLPIHIIARPDPMMVARGMQSYCDDRVP